MARRTRPGRPPVRRRTERRGIRWLTPADSVLDHADVIIVGGGATGVGLLWDLTLRGLDVILLEQGGLASGTSGAFHGLLHSGGRYAGSDPATAAECLTENHILRSVARPFVEDTGGVFVRLEEDDADWETRWLEGCRQAGLDARRLDRRDLLSREPALTQSLVSAYAVPDASIDGFGLLWSLLWSSAEAGARVYFRARVSGFLTDEAGVRGVTVVGRDERDEAASEGYGGAPGRQGLPAPRTRAIEPGEITAPLVINATGPWAAETAALAGPGPAASVPVERDKGVMLVFNARLVSTVVNRLRPPADGDILVPHGPVTILGTTSGRTRLAGRPRPEPGETALLMREGRSLVPALELAPPLRTYAGVRPLLQKGRDTVSEGAPGARKGRAPGHGPGRGEGRGFLLVDHGETDGLPGLLTVAGGKFTTFRAMAATTGDLVVRLLGRRARCRTAEVGVPRLVQGPASPGGGRPAGRAADLSGQLACECELVTLSTTLSLLDAGLDLADLRRLQRVGMGGCQGVFCSRRLAGALWQAGRPGTRAKPQPDEEAIAAELASFQRSRLAGVAPVEWGAQARLGALSRALARLTLGEPVEGERP